ncbi:APC family permease [Burkholderia stagnalis]|uniref:APC family permease n=1 Tax=Burkholderia stagnalis TaxID=1503054 RepID=UPI000F57C71A|nr:APC family permease [Burkholderia stagnalis]RQQ21737.1 APC family permease [Burkholderia stagnalis]RQQ23580.1 APC family permease [Burkholderia stagnalis]RQQ41743.1 APC family permease [Burkholderia stagnalis]RQX85484.1 APC family permease [Burkholderia stagnalis]RQY04855.1 APC family permease [Burkholderia stagnalis]
MQTSAAPSASASKRPLNWIAIVFFVLATNGPLTSLIGCVPYGVAYGNGIGIAGSYLCVGIIYLFFAVGFTAMSRHIDNAGALYAYVGKGLGRPAGVGAAFMAVASYFVITLACYALLGFYISYFIQSLAGVAVPWWVSTLVAAAVVHVFAVNNVQFNGAVLFLLMIVEIGLIVAFNIKIAANGGGIEHFSLTPLHPDNVFTGKFGTSLVFVVVAYMGFETTVIYANEVRNPSRSIPIATYVSVAVIMAIYVVSTVQMSNAFGYSEVVALAAKSPADLWFAVTERVLGKQMVVVTNALLITSMLAAIISFNNATVRYWYSLGRDGIAFRGLAHLSEKKRLPIRAANMQSAIMAALIVLFAAYRIDPVMVIAPYLSIPSAIGIVCVQALTALSVVRFFAGHRGRDTQFIRWAVFPTISFVGFTYFLYAMIRNVSLMAGTSSAIVSILPWTTPAIAVAGMAFATWIRHARPAVYAQLGRFLSDS